MDVYEIEFESDQSIETYYVQELQGWPAQIVWIEFNGVHLYFLSSIETSWHLASLVKPWTGYGFPNLGCSSTWKAGVS